jgi:hypothetical protein
MPPGAVVVVVELVALGEEDEVGAEVEVVVEVEVDELGDTSQVGAVPREQAWVVDVLVQPEDDDEPREPSEAVGAADPWATAMNPKVPTTSTPAASTPIVQPPNLSLSATP